MNMLRLLSGLGLLLLLMACSANQSVKKSPLPPLPQVNAINFGEPVNILEKQDIFKLTEQQQRHFLAFYNHPRYQNLKPHKRIFEYLQRRLDGFDFRGETYTASEALQTGAGNCLSLAIVTKALADLVDVELGYQKVNATPIYQKEQGVLLLSSHVRTFLYDPTYVSQENEWVLRPPMVIIDYFPDRGDITGGKVSEQEFISMYYRNLAARALVQQDYPKAYWLIKEALEYAPYHPENLNLLAVLFRKSGQLEDAEVFYQFAIEHTESSANLLSNYHLLLSDQNRDQDAEVIRKKLLSYQDYNPYVWLKLGHEAFQAGNIGEAIRHYQKVVEMAPYLDEGYFGLAKSYYQTGSTDKAATAMQQAVEKAFKEKTRNLYYAKLAILQGKEAENK